VGAFSDALAARGWETKNFSVLQSPFMDPATLRVLEWILCLLQEQRIGALALFPRPWGSADTSSHAADPLLHEARRLRGNPRDVLPRLLALLVSAARDAGAGLVLCVPKRGGCGVVPERLVQFCPWVGEGSSCSWGSSSRVDWDLYSSLPGVDAVCLPCRGQHSHSPTAGIRAWDQAFLPARFVRRLAVDVHYALKARKARRFGEFSSRLPEKDFSGPDRVWVGEFADSLAFRPSGQWRFARERHIINLQESSVVGTWARFMVARALAG